MNKVSVTKVENMVKESTVNSIDVEVNGLPINIKTSLSLENMRDVVSYLYNSSFSDSGEYLPETFDFAKRCIAIETYTNVTMPRNVEHKYNVAYNSGIYEAILQVADADQFEVICDAASHKIAYRVKINSDAIRSELVKVTEQFKEIAESLKLFSEITPEDMKSVMQAISEHGIDEEKLMSAYMKYKGDS